MKLKFLEIITASLLAAVVTTGCHSTPPPEPSPVFSPPTHDVPAQGIWVPDQIAAYSVGRYVDPNSPDVMHDAHTIYRREESGRWNLTPSPATASAATAMPNVGQFDANLLHDALTAELNRQRATSLALIGQAKILDSHLRELNAQSQEFRDVLLQFTTLRDQIGVVSNRLETIESRLRSLPQPSGP